MQVVLHEGAHKRQKQLVPSHARTHAQVMILHCSMTSRMPRTLLILLAYLVSYTPGAHENCSSHHCAIFYAHVHAFLCARNDGVPWSRPLRCWKHAMLSVTEISGDLLLVQQCSCVKLHAWRRSKEIYELSCGGAFLREMRWCMNMSHQGAVGQGGWVTPPVLEHLLLQGSRAGMKWLFQQAKWGVLSRQKLLRVASTIAVYYMHVLLNRGMHVSDPQRCKNRHA
eukprot:354984-Chlamydomonas_euryale.AAC.5